jgi:hypothetical protein
MDKNFICYRYSFLISNQFYSEEQPASRQANNQESYSPLQIHNLIQ